MIPQKKNIQYAVGYVRVSSPGQANNGISLDAQRDKIKKWVELNDATLLDIFSDEGITGSKDDKREGFQRAMDVAINNKAALVVYNLSRFSRSLRNTLQQAERLRHGGADLVSLSENIDTTTAAGKMVFNMTAVLNQFYIDQTSEATRSALEHRRSQGKKTGGFVPYGYTVDKDGRLHKDEQEQRTIQRILRHYRNGKRYVWIARRLNATGVQTKRGKRWEIQTVKNVIKANTKED